MPRAKWSFREATERESARIVPIGNTVSKSSGLVVQRNRWMYWQWL